MSTPAYQQSIADSFAPTINVSNLIDVQHTPVYDTVTIAQNGTIDENASLFFTNVGGGASPTKTLAQTNMTMSQVLPAPEVFSIRALRLRVAETIYRPDFDTILNQFCLEFWMGTKCYQRGPLWYFPTAGGLTGFSTNFVGDTAYTNGLASYESLRPLEIPLVIESMSQFYARFVGTAYTMTATASGGVGGTFVLLLDGFYGRRVQ
jgi:hypothetical protein